ncbi:hypothetical protein KJK34_14690 [Flavobacterium sp. D11R37]|uniref:hypothetical protein n=1 Tax=Flavobacterium coralii TaxID=2838017 RepID=UPI001CA6B82F|nr:hypothetical protein [Flavobacterium coralii]MBY8964003.1 hypothetical protein [Flavobacterium coralii]
MKVFLNKKHLYELPKKVRHYFGAFMERKSKYSYCSILNYVREVLEKNRTNKSVAKGLELKSMSLIKVNIAK